MNSVGKIFCLIKLQTEVLVWLKNFISINWKKTPIVMIFALVLSNTSISSDRILLEDFPFLSLLLEKINSGATDAVKCVQNAGKISENTCLWIYFAGDTMFQTCQFSKKSLRYCIAVREEQRVRLSHYRVFCRSKINWVVLSWTFGGWFNHQLHSRLLVHINFKEKRS